MFMFALLTLAGTCLFFSSASAAQVLTASDFEATLTSASSVSDPEYLLTVHVVDAQNQGGLGGSIAMVYSIGTKSYANSFVDAPFSTTDDPENKLNGYAPDFQEAITLSEGDNVIYIWGGRTLFGTSYTYLGSFTITYSSVKDYNIQLVSDEKVHISSYSLVANLSNVSSATEQVYYLLNSLDSTKGTKMNKNFFSPNRYYSAAPLQLKLGDNTIAVYVTDSQGIIRPGAKSIKLLTVNYSLAPVTFTPVDPVVDPVVQQPIVDPIVREPISVEDPQPLENNTNNTDTNNNNNTDNTNNTNTNNTNNTDNTNSTNEQVAMDNTQQDLADREAALATREQQLQQELDMLDQMATNDGGNGSDQGQEDLSQMMRDQLTQQLDSLHEEQTQVAMEQDAVELLQQQMDTSKTPQDDTKKADSSLVVNPWIMVAFSAVIAMLLGVIVGLVVRNKKNNDSVL